MPDLRNMTTAEAEAYRAGWQAAKEQAADMCRWKFAKSPPGHNNALRHEAAMDCAAAIRAMEPGE